MVNDIVHLTREGYRKFEEELQHLLTVRREEVAGRLHQALEEGGELIENAEYADAKNEQAFVEGRIQELESLLARAEIIDIAKITGSKVKFGATVTIVNEDTDEEKTYQIVGEQEADVKSGKISITSPIARALIGKVTGDSVEVTAPGGARSYEILSVRYS